MVEFKVRADTSAKADRVIEASRDFSERRIEIWPNVSPKGYEVHAVGETFAEVTETVLAGWLWERSRYEWSRSGTVVQTVLDSNVLEPRSTWQLTATPNDRGCHVEALFRRRFRRTPKGLLGYLLNRLFGRQIHGSALRRTLAAIEAG